MNFDELMEQIKNPIDDTALMDASDIEKNKGFGIVGCFPGLFWLPLIAARESQYGKFYANQGFITFLISTASGVIGSVFRIIPVIGGLIGGLLSSVLGLLAIATFIFSIAHAVQGRAVRIPVLGTVIDIFK